MITRTIKTHVWNKLYLTCKNFRSILCKCNFKQTASLSKPATCIALKNPRLLLFRAEFQCSIEHFWGAAFATVHFMEMLNPSSINKMVKQLKNCLSAFDHFVRLALNNNRLKR